MLISTPAFGYHLAPDRSGLIGPARGILPGMLMTMQLGGSSSDAEHVSLRVTGDTELSGLAGETVS